MKKTIILTSMIITTPLVCMNNSLYLLPEGTKVLWWSKICEKGQKCGMNPLSILFQQDVWDKEMSIIPATEHFKDRKACDIIQRDIKHALSYKDTHINDQDAKTLMTPLHWACMGHLPYYRTLLATLLDESTININIQDANGKTPLYFACKEAYWDSRFDNRVDMLLATRKVNFSLCDKEGKDIAQYVCDMYKKMCESYENKLVPINKIGMECLRRYEIVMHKVVHAASRPLRCALIKAMLQDEGTEEQSQIALCLDVKSLIMRFFYMLHIEIIMARKYKPWRHKTGQHIYYDQSFCQRKKIKKCIMQSPTREDVSLLWR